MRPEAAAMTDHEIYARNMLSDNRFTPWRPGPVNIPEVGYVVRVDTALWRNYGSWGQAK